MMRKGSMGTKERRGRWPPLVLLCLRVLPCLFVALLGGCHRRQVVPTLPAVVQAPVTPPPTPADPKMKSPPPESLSTAPAVKVTEAKPKSRPRRSTQKAATPAPVPVPAETVAAVAPPSESATLGELSAGGESSPKSQQEASELIVSSERRLDALSKTKAKPPDDQTREVRHFLQQAREALATGDAEGARTLATKAKLLMDDLEKWAQQ